MDCITDALMALSDDNALTLFNMVAFSLSQDTGSVMTRLGLTRKQCYSRMNRLIDAGLVTRKNGKYFLRHSVK
jgi:predicted transcriptional regulator